MHIERRVFNDVVVLSIEEPRIDAAAAIQFKESVREMAEDSPARVVLDMTNVAFLDSSGLGALVAVMKHLGPQRTLELCSLSSNVSKVFKLTRMDTVFVIHEALDDAIDDLKNVS